MPKVIEIWLAEYDPNKMKKTQMVIKASKGKVIVTEDKEALEEALDIMDDSGVAWEPIFRRMWGERRGG